MISNNTDEKLKLLQKKLDEIEDLRRDIKNSGELKPLYNDIEDEVYKPEALPEFKYSRWLTITCFATAISIFLTFVAGGMVMCILWGMVSFLALLVICPFTAKKIQDLLMGSNYDLTEEQSLNFLKVKKISTVIFCISFFFFITILFSGKMYMIALILLAIISFIPLIIINMHIGFKYMPSFLTSTRCRHRRTGRFNN